MGRLLLLVVLMIASLVDVGGVGRHSTGGAEIARARYTCFFVLAGQGQRLELVRQVAADRTAGVSLAWAIERAIREAEPPAASLYAALRRRRRTSSRARCPSGTCTR